MAGEFGNPDRKSSLIEPLTTIWTIPGGCPSPVPLVDDNHTTLDSSCYPPDDWTIWESLGFYSPGICPRGYTSGCKVTDSAYGGTVRPTETAAICVPSSYSCSDYLIYASSVSGNDTITVPAFQIRWAKSDLTAFETSRSTSSSATSTSSSSSTSHPHPTGLPTGAIVGIALGSAAVVAILSGFMFFLFRRRGRRGTQKSHVSPDKNPPKDGLAELETPTQPAELATATRSSQGRGSVHELQQGGKSTIPELGGADGMLPELAGTLGTGGRHELGAEERSIPELEGNNGSRHELS
ncbi:uncharacterized protein NECHADRAFT_78398 [Fusarium vanettenii 77-13-4]|uniref:Uncharacterized protein n=1 Tax=Fusarium vanettenii (strain ATCC MYA-4622 / CBS 123669 / FGSC 9596 / NRRL 45880 / 77-13-4) TaxID=660122 RepID=C7ZFA6_FUSV7|nr:uncharacterized protein NECHADRAFT_78398 [Fusarium vanettenii 77-13-4]EEU37187.1 hypothetical protein NECHADRAFT_78398 [Fusarium vanettenii 77-13-4]